MVKNKKKLQFILIGVIVALIAVFVALYFFIGNKDDNNKKTEKETTTEYIKTESDYIKEAGDFETAADFENAYITYQSAAKLNENNIDTFVKLMELADKLDKKTEKQNYQFIVMDMTKGNADYTELREKTYLEILKSYVEKEDNASANALLQEIETEFTDFAEKNLSGVEITKTEETPVFAEDGYIYFGSYPQEEIPDEEVSDYIKKATFDENGEAIIYGRKIAKIEGVSGIKYFSYSPIQWRLLVDKKNGEYILMTNKVLDCQSVMNDMDESSWDVSDQKKWLNTVYYEKAFNDTEKEYIIKMLLRKPKNYFYSTENGADSEDFLVVLSCYDLVYSEYGLRDEDVEIRKAEPTAYALAKGVFENDGFARWWTSSNGSNNFSYVYVDCDGLMSAGGELADYSYIGLRPVMTIKLK